MIVWTLELQLTPFCLLMCKKFESYLHFVQDNNYFEDAFKVYEEEWRSLNICMWKTFGLLISQNLLKDTGSPNLKGVESYLSMLLKWYCYFSFITFLICYELMNYDCKTYWFDLYDCLTWTDPCESCKAIYLHYAKLEEDFGLAKRAMRISDQAKKAVSANEKLSM